MSAISSRSRKEGGKWGRAVIKRQTRISPISDGKNFYHSPLFINDGDHWLNKTFEGHVSEQKTMVRKSPGIFWIILVGSVRSCCGAADGDNGPRFSRVPTTNHLVSLACHLLLLLENMLRKRVQRLLQISGRSEGGATAACFLSVRYFG